MRSLLTRPALTLFLLLAIPVVAVVAQQREKPPSKDIQGTPMYMVLPLDGIPSINDPVFVSAKEAAKLTHPDEPFLGVVIDGEAHAYSTWLLDSHEIVNDTVGKIPIAATW
jgi:hypothetical protein